MKKVIAAVISSLLFLGLAGCSASEADPTYVEELIKLPDSKEVLLEHTEMIAVIKVMDTEIMEFPDAFDSKTDSQKYYISTAKIEKVFMGEQPEAQEVKILQRGDNKTKIYKSVIYSGGYLETEDRWLLLLNELPAEVQQQFEETIGQIPYEVCPLVGQYKLSADDNFISITDESKKMFGNLQSVDSMKVVCDQYLQKKESIS